MKRVLRGLAACLAFLHAGVGWSQSPGKSGTDHHFPQGSKSGSVPAFAGAFASAFADYRRFDPDEPLVDWRAANEEVKNAGGHVGLVRAHGAGGARPRTEQKAVTPPAKGHH